MSTVVRHAARVWIPIAVALTALSLAVYAAVQQDLRQGANDPQIEMAEDAAAALNNGAVPQSVLPDASVELSTSLKPFVMVFDRSDSLLASDATLHGGEPPFPTSVLQNLRGTQGRITWQPEPGVRSAVVLQAWQGGFVVVGRSLRLVEEREQTTLELAALVWLASLGATALAAVAAVAVLV